MLRILFSYNVWKIYFLVFIEELDSKGILNSLKKELHQLWNALTLQLSLSLRDKCTVPIKGHGIMIYFWTGDRHLELVIATLNWRSPLWNGGSPLWTGDHHFELAIATLNWRFATLNWRSLLWTGDCHFKLAIRYSELAISTLNSPICRWPCDCWPVLEANGCSLVKNE